MAKRERSRAEVAEQTRSEPQHIFPRSRIAGFDRELYADRPERFAVDAVAPLVGMSPYFVKRIVGSKRLLGVNDVLTLLDQDAYHETFVPRSMILPHLLARSTE